MRASHQNPPVIRKLMRYNFEIKVLKKCDALVVTAQFSHHMKILQTKPTTKNTRSKIGQKTEIRRGEQRREVGVA